ncbi:MAG: dUTP diphosphatase [Victivallales bacterium]|nr:dUTP diphosphatase [Victivallales bacterium]
MDKIFYTLEPGDAELLPRKAHASDAAYDLRSSRDLTLAPGEFAAVPTGVHLELPPDYVADVRPRSGLALKHGVTVLNAPGTIDSGYRGEIQAILVNHGKAPFEIRRGDRIAQLLFLRLPECGLVPAEQLGASDRGDAGFGSTGRT